MNEFNHVAKDLIEHKKVVFTAFSKKNFYQRMLISKHAFENDVVPINPFTNFGYYLCELVDRDLVRNGNNNLLKRCDELWVYGDISDGVLTEIILFKELNKPIRYFDIVNLPKEVKEINKDQLIFEDGLEKHKDKI